MARDGATKPYEGGPGVRNS